jgi:hypothetical protein
VLPDSILREFLKATALQQKLIEAAWPAFSVESKLEVLASFEHIPAYLTDMALSDPAEIVRFFGARHHYFRRHMRLGDLEVPESLKVSSEEIARTEKASSDPSSLVRAAVDTSGIGLIGLIDQPQLVRLLRIRNMDFPSTGSFAAFVEKAMASNVPNEEVRDCLWEYFAREDVFEEMKELDADGPAQFDKTGGWELLWKIAATAPAGIAAAIANKAPLEGKLWEVSQEALAALPDKIKCSFVFRDETPAAKLRESILAAPEGYSEQVVKSVKNYYEMIADYGRSSKEQRAAANLEKTPNRIDAIFQSIRLVQKTLDAQTADSEELAEKEKQALADRKLLDSIRFVAWIIVGLLAAILWFRR